MSHRISVINNIVDSKDLSFLISKIKDFDKNTTLSVYKDNPCVLVAPETDEIISIIKKYSEIAIKLHKEKNGFVADLYTTEGFLSVWKEGSWAGVHTDSHANYEFLQFSTVIYLNDDFTGGETYFPNQDFLYTPKSGDILLFPSGGTEYVHGVKKVLSGNRYTIAMWHSSRRDKRHSKIYKKSGQPGIISHYV